MVNIANKESSALVDRIFMVTFKSASTIEEGPTLRIQTVESRNFIVDYIWKFQVQGIAISSALFTMNVSDGARAVKPARSL